MPAEVWLWLLYHNHCGIKITGSNYTKHVAAGMWSNFVVDYLLVDSGLGGSGNYHADSLARRLARHLPHHPPHPPRAGEREGRPRPLGRPAADPRPQRRAASAPGGGTRLFASGGLRGELDMIKVLIAGADGLVEASIGKAVAFGCNQCGNCHLDCPRGGITTKPELTIQNERAPDACSASATGRCSTWSSSRVLIDALNREQGALDATGRVVAPEQLIDDIRAAARSHRPARACRVIRAAGARRRVRKPTTTPAASARWPSPSRSPCTRSGRRRAAPTTVATTAAAGSTSRASRRPPWPIRPV